MKKLSKRLLSLLLVVCIAVSMSVMALPTANATAGAAIASAIGKKALELGLRFASAAAVYGAEQAEDDDASIAVTSFIRFILSDGTGAAVSDIKSMCKNMLVELAEIKEDIRVYTAEISSAIDRGSSDEKKTYYKEKWESDVTKVIHPDNASGISFSAAYDAYIKYYISATLHQNHTTISDEAYDQIAKCWKELFDEELTEADYKDISSVEGYSKELEYTLLEIQLGKDVNDRNADSARASVYKNAFTFLQFKKTINKLVDNYRANDASSSGKVYTVVDAAATDAYYAFPFAHQQRAYIETAAKEQIMTVTFMELCFNEYLAFQADYFNSTREDGWEEEYILSYTDNANERAYMSYNECVLEYNTIIEKDLQEAVALMEEEYKINTTAYSGDHTDAELSLNDFMPAEDAQTVTLQIIGYEENHEYWNDIKGTEADEAESFGDTYLPAKVIKQNVDFIRVQAGGGSGEVYYVLDPDQFAEDSDADIGTLITHIKRYTTLEALEGFYGDLYPVSVDYMNLTKTMTDGTNNFRVSSSSSVSNDLHDLIHVPYFSAVAGFKISGLLGNMFRDPGAKTHLITSSYSNNYNDGILQSQKCAEIKMVDTASGNDYVISTEDIKVHEAGASSADFSVVLVLQDDVYKQTAALSADDASGKLSDCTVTYTDGTSEKSFALGESAAIQSGNKVSVNFALENEKSFDSLVMIRKNKTQTETVLIDNITELGYFRNNDGTYTYETQMPYSDVEFVIKTKEFTPVATVSEDDVAETVDAFAIIKEGTYNDVIANIGESCSIKAGETVNFKITIDRPDTFESIVAVTGGKETVVVDYDTYMAAYDNTYAGNQYVSVTMPDDDTEFIIRTKKLDTYRVTPKEEDPADIIKDLMVHGEYYSVYKDDTKTFERGEELTISFILMNEGPFESLVAVNSKTRDITTLVTADQLSTLGRDGYQYLYTTTMPSYDVEYIVTSKQSEEFVPNELDEDETGTFIIRTYEDLRSMAYFVNTGDTYYTQGNYILANDIDVLGRDLEPIAATEYNDVIFEGTFDGQGYQISNLKMLCKYRSNTASLFGRVSGEIKNLKLGGTFTAYNAKSLSTGTTVYATSLATRIEGGGKVTNVQTNLNYKVVGTDKVPAIGALVYSAGDASVFEKCMVNDTINLPTLDAGYSGIAYNASGTVKFVDCANISEVTLGNSNYAAGIVYGSSYQTYEIENCYVACKLTGGTLSPWVGTPVAYPTVTNSYYLETSVSEGSKYSDYGTPVSANQFNSGEIAYLLNSGVTDDTQVWYQNIDNGKSVDAYPFYNGGTVYKTAGTCVKEGEGYTNTPGEITHNYNKYHVCKDCIGLRPGEAAGIYGFSIGLGGNISVQYYMVIDEEVACDETAKMVFEVPDTGSSYKLEIPLSEAKISGKFHIFECEVAAKEMTSDIYCQVVTDTRESDVFYYTVKSYADVILANGDVYAKEVPLVKAMLNYGANAQLSFAYRVNDLANESVYITEAEKFIPAVNFSDYEYKLEGTQAGVSYYGSAISLKSETAIKHYFRFNNAADVETTSVTVNGKAAKLVKNGGYYELKISDIPAHKLHESYTVKVGGITLEYSVFSYCYVAADKGANSELANVAYALYAYNKAALEYKG